ncbi:hypothetical protein AGMMS49965_15550 [Bacteroidia bacterium]|nr:hypothetical protein AGMMS49965_15550 [Bacteroidia bacterium]
MTEQLLSEWPVAQNWGFVLFLICFFISMQVLGRGRRLLFSMLEGIFRRRNRQSIFFENIQHELVNKLLLSTQTIFLLSIFIFCIVLHRANVPLESLSQMFWLVGVCSGVIIFYLIVKFILNALFGAIFSESDQTKLFNQNVFSIVALSGLVLFVPTAILFYAPDAYYFCLYFNIIYLLFVEFLIIYKIHTIFFPSIKHLLYFILYLCTLEVVPLYLGYRALIYLLENSSLWVI